MRGYGKNFVLGFALSLAGLVFLIIVLTTFERPPVESVQRGFRGTGMELVYNPRSVAAELAVLHLPEVLDPADNEGPRASEIYENVQVLGGLSSAASAREGCRLWSSSPGDTNRPIGAWRAPGPGHANAPLRQEAVDAVFEPGLVGPQPGPLAGELPQAPGGRIVPPKFGPLTRGHVR